MFFYTVSFSFLFFAFLKTNHLEDRDSLPIARSIFRCSWRNLVRLTVLLYSDRQPSGGTR